MAKHEAPILVPIEDGDEAGTAPCPMCGGRMGWSGEDGPPKAHDWCEECACALIASAQEELYSLQWTQAIRVAIHGNLGIRRIIVEQSRKHAECVTRGHDRQEDGVCQRCGAHP